jgi:N-acyl-D-amino-acid deacylase
MRNWLYYLFFTLIIGCGQIALADAPLDVIIKGGTVYDGTGEEGHVADVAIRGDRIVGVGDFAQASAKKTIDARGLAVAPGFINMLSWSDESLIQDGKSQSEIRQGVTTEIMGEGESMGPLNDGMKARIVREQTDIKFEIKWNTLAEYLRYLEKRGVSCNVASFLGATTVREYVIGLEDKQPTPEQLDQMRELVRKEMEAGALGIGDDEVRLKVEDGLDVERLGAADFGLTGDFGGGLGAEAGNADDAIADAEGEEGLGDAGDE